MLYCIWELQIREQTFSLKARNVSVKLDKLIVLNIPFVNLLLLSIFLTEIEFLLLLFDLIVFSKRCLSVLCPEGE